MKYDVFIVHSSKDSDAFHQLKQWLEQDAQIKVFPNLLTPGEIVTEELAQIVEESLICLFLATDNSLDQAWCHAEMGAFWGASKDVLVLDRISTDTEKGFTNYPQLQGKVMTSERDVVKKRILECIDDEKNSTDKSHDIRVIVPLSEVIKKQVSESRTPDSWQSRDLYLGVQGARNWLAVSKDTSYASIGFHRSDEGIDINELLTNVISHVNCKCFVSLGPGDVSCDISILRPLRNKLQAINKRPSLKYIPVDINPYLLSLACEKARQLEIEVPFGILADFDEEINRVLDECVNEADGEILFSLLGYTFGNMDGSETEWLDKVKSKMRSGDYLLIDFLVADNDFNADEYITNAHKDYTEPMKHWLAFPVSSTTGISRNKLVQNFEANFRFTCANTGVGSRVDTKIIYTGDGEKECIMPVTNMYRYRIDKIKAFVTEQIGFEIVASEYDSDPSKTKRQDDDHSKSTNYDSSGMLLLRK